MVTLNPFSKTKKELGRALEEQQRLQNALVEQRRKEAQLEEETRRRLEYERRAREAERLREEAAHAREMEEERRRLEEARRQMQMAQQAREELEHQEAQRQLQEMERQRAERARLEREARIRQKKAKKIKQASPETLRTLRELIRDKYQLDIEIWRLRNARRPDRWIVEAKMEKADAVVKEIMDMVTCWEDQREGNWDDEEWERVQEIRKRLMDGGVRIWADNPLWQEAQGGGGRRVSAVMRQKTMATRAEAPDRQY